MDKMMKESLRDWKDMFHNDNDQARAHLSAIVHYATESLHKSDVSSLEEIGFRIETAIQWEKPDDPKSFNLGMARAMVQMINLWMHHAEREEMMASLPTLEQGILRCLSVESFLTPTQIMEKLGLENRQHMSNLLRKLRVKQLVSYRDSGKNHWYTLTSEGRRVWQEVSKASDEQAAGQDLPSNVVDKKSSDVSKKSVMFSTLPNNWERVSNDGQHSAYNSLSEEGTVKLNDSSTVRQQKNRIAHHLEALEQESEVCV